MALTRPVVIDENICEGCGTCYEVFGCPAIGRQQSGQAFIHGDLCNGNGSCIQVCSVHAIVRPDKDDTAEDIRRKYRHPGKVPDPGKCEPGEGG
jgi:TPP-dependent indolepyruvate ferredoxin oxidoreductase alpha subunit